MSAMTHNPDPAADFTNQLTREWLLEHPRKAVLEELTFWSNEFAAPEVLTELALSLSLCPLHLIDYAICFDDQYEECRAIREVHPSHDT